MLIVMRSPVPALDIEAAEWPAEMASILHRVVMRPLRCQWIVPTKRRRRALQQQWLASAATSASLLPALHTLESFVAQALEYSRQQRPFVAGRERLLRLARIWQDLSGQSAGPGLVNHLSRFVRDTQACKLPIKPKRGDIFANVVRRYLTELDEDGRFDRMSGVAALTQEIQDPESWPNRLFLRNLEVVVFDGFHRLEIVELEMIAALSHHCPVAVWLVGSPGTPASQAVEAASALLKKQGHETRLVDHAPDVRERPQVLELEAESQRAEVEAVARRIKADYRTGQASGTPCRLSDVAVVIPGPAYDPLIREVFPRYGLEFNLAGRALLVASSRPARVLDAALQLIRGQWQHERLRDFLHLQLVRRRLADSHRLTYLFEHRPRFRRRLDLGAWLSVWKKHLAWLADRVAAWRIGQPLPDGTKLSREQLIAQESELHASSMRLLASIEALLRPLAELEATLNKPGDPEQPMKPMGDACIKILDALEIDQWLKPAGAFRGADFQSAQTAASTSRTTNAGQSGRIGNPSYDESDDQSDVSSAGFNLEGVAVPWVEYEKDQQAYLNLLSILQSLREMRGDRLPQTTAGRLDVLAILHLALSGETYQIRTEDDAGVQLFEVREIRGLRFRHVYALGLIDGQVPAVPEEGILAQRRWQDPTLARQLKQKEAEADYLFAQFFEAAQERLVLCRPTHDADQKTLPSRYLTAIKERLTLPPLEPATLIGSARLLAINVARGSPLQVNQAGDPLVNLLQVRLADWRARRPRQVQVDAPMLLALFYPAKKAFSPSELETYAACPFRYFADYLLRLEEREPDQTRLHYGSLVHRVLQSFYVELRETYSGSEDDPLPQVAEQHRERLLELFEREWAALDEGLIPPDLRRLFAHPQGVLQLFIEAIKLVEADHGNWLNEFVLHGEDGQPVSLVDDGSQPSAYVTGKIDRVDRHRETATQAVVLDYKTGRPAGPTELKEKMTDGRLLQLPLYAAALSRLRPGLEVVGGAYLHLSEREANVRSAVASAGALAPRNNQRYDVPFDIAAAVSKTLELIARMRGGDFSLTEHSPTAHYPECTSYCAFRHACRHPQGYR